MSDIDGRRRQGIVFHLVPTDQANTIDPEDEQPSLPATLTIEELRSAALAAASAQPNTRRTPATNLLERSANRARLRAPARWRQV